MKNIFVTKLLPSIFCYRKGENMKFIIPDIKQYQTISAEVWQIFKKYYQDGADVMTITDDMHVLDQKYKSSFRMHEFYMKLMKVFFEELNEVKEMKKKNAEEMQ